MENDNELVRVNFGVSWKDKKKRRIRTRDDFIMVPRNSSVREIGALVKEAVRVRHPNTMLTGYVLPVELYDGIGELK